MAEQIEWLSIGTKKRAVFSFTSLTFLDVKSDVDVKLES